MMMHKENTRGMPTRRPLRKRIRSAFGRLARFITLAAVALLVLGCADPNQGGDASQKRMGFSTGEYNQGYKRGKSEAKWSLTDIHAAWTWLWMMEKEYQQGYEQGWKDGRQELKVEEKRKQHDQEEAQ